jgi:hypothetical protein
MCGDPPSATHSGGGASDALAKMAGSMKEISYEPSPRSVTCSMDDRGAAIPLAETVIDEAEVEEPPSEPRMLTQAMVVAVESKTLLSDKGT